MAVVETVEARPLDQILDAGIIDQARFIKIDVEGAEWAVVKSLGALLKTLSPRTEIIIEINQRLVQLSGGTVEELLGYFAAAGFSPFVIANRYDVGFLGRKVRQVRLQPLEGWTENQLDLVFRHTAHDTVQ